MSAPGKRRIGGHFGAALGASTKRQRAGWRDEVEEDDVAANTQAGDDDDSEEAVLDPGTPLPSEEEDLSHNDWIFGSCCVGAWSCSLVMPLFQSIHRRWESQEEAEKAASPEKVETAEDMAKVAEVRRTWRNEVY
eukprot:g4284.t1